MAKAIGSLRFDIVANASGMVSGLRKARKEMTKTQKQAARASGSKSGNRAGGLFRGGVKGTMARAGPTITAMSIAATLAALALRKLTKTAQDQAAESLKMAEILRKRAVLGRTIQQQQALLAAQIDPLGRGPDFAQTRMAAMGTQITSAQLSAAARLTESQQALAESFSALGRELMVQLSPTLIAFNNAAAKGVGSLGRFVSSQIEFVSIFDTLLQQARGFGGPFGGARGRAGESERMMDALRAQNDANRVTGKKSGDIKGPLPRPGGGAAGSAGEYAFFVRRQDRLRNEELAELKEQNVLLSDIKQRIGANPTGTPAPAAAQTPAVAGVP